MKLGIQRTEQIQMKELRRRRLTKMFKYTVIWYATLCSPLQAVIYIHRYVERILPVESNISTRHPWYLMFTSFQLSPDMLKIFTLHARNAKLKNILAFFDSKYLNI